MGQQAELGRSGRKEGGVGEKDFSFSNLTFFFPNPNPNVFEFF
jgi:hypothetical protein